MELNGDAKLLRIFIDEQDKLEHQPLYKALLLTAREQGMAGCTLLKGGMSFGAGAMVHTAKLIDVSEDLPVVVEIVDSEEKINGFMDTVNEMMERTGCGGLITLEKAGVLYYKHREKK